MGQLKEAGGTFAIGCIATLILWIVFAFFPSMMVSLSITDTFWDLGDANCYVWFCITFIILGFIQVAMIQNIRQCWGIIVPWFLLSIYPFIMWLMWVYDDIPFPGVDWMPW